MEHIYDLLNAGCDKVSLNSSALKNPDLITQGAKRFGSQCIVVAIDAKRRTNGKGWEVYTHGTQQHVGWIWNNGQRNPVSAEQVRFCLQVWIAMGQRQVMI